MQSVNIAIPASTVKYITMIKYEAKVFTTIWVSNEMKTNERQGTEDKIMKEWQNKVCFCDRSALSKL